MPESSAPRHSPVDIAPQPEYKSKREREVLLSEEDASSLSVDIVEESLPTLVTSVKIAQKP